MPASALSKHIGTTRITASGSDQLSYSPASTKNTSTAPSTNALNGFCCRSRNCSIFARLLLQVAQLGPFRGHVPRQVLAARLSIVARTSPVLTPGSDAPVIVAAGNML